METSINYLLTNEVLPEEIYLSWGFFQSVLEEGPEKVKAFILELRKDLSEYLKKELSFKVLDLDSKLLENDIELTMSLSKNQIRVFYFILPDSTLNIVESKAVAIALTPEKPRYFTMEYVPNKETSFTMNELHYNIYSRKMKKTNLGELESNTVDEFAGTILALLEYEYEDHLIEEV